MSGHQSFKVTITASVEHETPHREYVLYELDLKDLAGESSELHSDERMEEILSIIQIGPKEPVQWDQRGNFSGVSSFKVGYSSAFSRKLT